MIGVSPIQTIRMANDTAKEDIGVLKHALRENRPRIHEGIMRIGNFILYKEKAGIISENPIWIIFHSCYMYTHESLLKCLWLFVIEYKSDRHLVG